MAIGRGSPLDLSAYIRNVPDFPKPGIQFKDITPLLQSGPAFRYVIDGWKERYATKQLDAIVGVDARGFIFGTALAYAMGLPFIPVRKKGKLPHDTFSEDFELEYGTDTLEVHIDAVSPGHRVVLVDDLLATGGTMVAVTKLVEKLGAKIEEIACVVELTTLGGRERLAPYRVHALIQFEVDE